MEGARIVAGSDPVVLRGFGLGGWMNMENFITGFADMGPSSAAPCAASWATQATSASSQGSCRCSSPIGMPRSSRDPRPELGADSLQLPALRKRRPLRSRSALRDSGSWIRWSTRVPATGSTPILDLHAVPGSAESALAQRQPHAVGAFLGSAAVPGPCGGISGSTSPTTTAATPGWPATTRSTSRVTQIGTTIGPFYERLESAIRAVDPDHILFLDGNRYSTQFDPARRADARTASTPHTTTRCPASSTEALTPGSSRGQYIDRDRIEETFLARTEYMREKRNPHLGRRVRPGLHPATPLEGRPATSTARGPTRDLRARTTPSWRAVDLQGHRPARDRYGRSCVRVS